MNSRHFVKLICGPVGGGKSTVALQELWRQAMAQPPINNVRRTKFMILRNTMAGSFLDMPSLTLPTGLNAHGLPAALMVSATSGRDETVLAAGKLFAQILTNDQVLNRMRMQAC